MMHTLRARAATKGLAALIAVAATVVATGCGSDGSSSGGGSRSGAAQTTREQTESSASQQALAAAQRFVAPYTKAPVWRGPQTSPPVAGDKHIVFVNTVPGQPTLRAVGAAAQEAGRALGWHVTEIAASKVTDAPDVFDRAIAQKPDGILFGFLDTTVYPSIAAALVKSKIPTVVVGVVPNKANASAWTHIVDIDHSLQGQLTAAAAVLDRKADAKLGVLAVAPGANLSGDTFIAGVKSFLDSNGGGSIVGTKPIDINTLTDPSAVGQAAVAFAQATPALNTFYVGYDGTASSVVPALRQAGLIDKVHVLAHDGDPQNLTWVREGGGQVADVVWAQAWATWAAFDDFNRIFNRVPPSKDDGIPLRLFTKDHPKDGNNQWSGDLDFRARYKSLWKVR
ncbi:sugar ABC transporter substrate-binding protein [Frankia sp. QA3]|uniref:sugar ABC transporter substrate-binding protein n=1 Tax=Frankia sp. QA3 TaxID=710111 RepID=UPI000269CEB4|nr:sugar ABC transporter substrate-binding protein [Frankia sp. QA3]EIV96243.1 ABC-type sugar transport system, periplasmic component [Frankia sp. QA3]